MVSAVAPALLARARGAEVSDDADPGHPAVDPATGLPRWSKTAHIERLKQEGIIAAQQLEIERLRADYLSRDISLNAALDDVHRLTEERDEARQRFNELRDECIKVDWRNEFRIKKLLEPAAYSTGGSQHEPENKT
jgi:hypothetical protein